MPHDVFDVVLEDPDVQHIVGEVHSSTVEKYARDQRGIGGNGHIRFGEARLSEYKRRDRLVLEDEGIVRADRKANLVEKDEDAAAIEMTVTTGVSSVGLSSCRGITVHLLRGRAATVDDRSGQCRVIR